MDEQVKKNGSPVVVMGVFVVALLIWNIVLTNQVKELEDDLRSVSNRTSALSYNLNEVSNGLNAVSNDWRDFKGNLEVWQFGFTNAKVLAVTKKYYGENFK